MTNVHVEWDNPEQTIIRYDFSKGWTWDEYYAATKTGDALIDSTTHQLPVGAILYIPDPTLPTNVLRGTQIGMKARHPRAVLVVLVTRNRFVHALYEVVVSAYRSLKEELLRADTLEDARALLSQRLASQWTGMDKPKS